MRRVGLALATCVLCGCSSIFGLDRAVRRLDAQPSDAPVDAPYACPPIGTPPRFGTTLRPAGVGDCYDYSIGTAANVAMAMCNSAPSFGAVDQPLLPIALSGVTGTVIRPMLAPEGDQALVTSVEMPASTTTVAAISNIANDWTVTQTILNSASTGVSISNPTQRPGPRHFVYWDPSNSALVEMVEQTDGTWTGTASYSAAELGVDAAGNPSLTPDGLRLVMLVTRNGGMLGIAYADRASPSAPFSKAVDLNVTSAAVSPFMTPDCGRIYFEANHEIVYATQL